MGVVYIRCVPNATSKPARLFFECRRGREETGISLFLREQALGGDGELLDFQEACKLPSGDLPALWEVTNEALQAVSLRADRKPEGCPIEHRYRESHFETHRCPSKGEAEQLALAVQLHGGPLRPFRSAS